MLAANAIYAVCAKVALHLIRRKIAWMIENPRNSYLWLLKCIREVITLDVVDHVMFQHCMYGSGRNKWTKLHFFPRTSSRTYTACATGSTSTNPGDDLREEPSPRLSRQSIPRASATPSVTAWPPLFDFILVLFFQSCVPAEMPLFIVISTTVRPPDCNPEE